MRRKKATEQVTVGELHDASADQMPVNTDMQNVSSDASNIWVKGHKVV